MKTARIHRFVDSSQLPYGAVASFNPNTNTTTLNRNAYDMLSPLQQRLAWKTREAVLDRHSLEKVCTPAFLRN